MGQMQRGFIKEGFLKLYQNQGTGQEVAVLGEGTKMTTETVITGGEVAVGVGIGMTVTDTMVGTETTVDEAGAVVPVLITTGAGEGGAMMMKGGVLTPYRSRSQSPYRSRSRSPYRSIDSASPARCSPSPRKSPSPLSRSRSASSDRRSLDGQSPTSRSVSPRHRPADSRSPSPRNSDFDIDIVVWKPIVEAP